MKKYFLTLFIAVILFTGCSDTIKNDNDKKIVAFISLSSVDDNTFSGFKERMNDLGWKENGNISYIIAGAAKNVKFLPDKVKSAIDKKPDLILVSSTPATQEVKKQNTKGIPVVFCPVNDPSGTGIVENTNKPEGFITGVRLPSGDEKRTEWLYRLKPDIKNILVPYTPNDNSSRKSRTDIKKIAKELNLNIIEIPLKNADNIDQYLKNIPKNIDAVILPRDSLVESMIEKFVNYSFQKKLPLSVPSYQQVQKGGLYTFGFIHKELGKDAANIADKILKGVKVTDLPVKFGSAFLVLNETTADKIGIKFDKDTISSAKLVIKQH